MPFAHPPSFIFSIHYSLTRISSQVVMATRLSRSCPFIGSPLAPPPLRVLVSPHIFRPLHLVRCALYNMFHGHQLPPRQQRPSKSNHESPSAQYVTRSTTFRSLRVFAASHLVSQAIKFKSTTFIFRLGSSLVPSSQSLLVLSYIRLSFSVPALCTMKPGRCSFPLGLPAGSWVHLSIIMALDLVWHSLDLLYCMDFSGDSDCRE